MNAFAALADQTRREIVCLIAENGELAASEISKNFRMTSPAISQHLKILREAKIIRMKKDAQKRLYRVDESGLNEVGNWLADVKSLWNERFDNLDRYLKNLKEEEKK